MGFRFKMFPNKPIHQRGHWRFPGWWIISAEGLGLIGDSKSSWEKRARSHRANPTGNIEKDVQKAMETEWFRERVYNWWMFMDFPHWTLSLLEGKYHKIVIYQLNNGILPLQNWDLTMKNWDSKFHPMSWVSSIAMSISTCGVIQITCFFDSQCVFPFEMMKSAWSVGFPYFPCFTGRYWKFCKTPQFVPWIQMKQVTQRSDTKLMFFYHKKLSGSGWYLPHPPTKPRWRCPFHRGGLCCRADGQPQLWGERKMFGSRLRFFQGTTCWSDH